MARYVTVASVSHNSLLQFKGNLQAVLDHAARMLRRAAHHGANIVSFPEIYPHFVLEGKPADIAEPVSGPTLTRIAEEARNNHLHVIMPLYTSENGRVYNSSVLISPKGDVIGIYHKIHPTIGEIETGITPGTEPLVFRTDFGKVGMAICFDLNFRDAMRGLADNGAEIIFFSSAYRGGLQLRIWAFELGVYIVSAILAELGRIVDQSGTVLAESTYEELIARRINLDRRLLHMDYNWDKMDAMLEKYGTGLSFEYFTREACYTVASERDDLTVDDLIREFGLMERRAYWERANQVRADALASLKD
jgi:predicted amidohydrolase